jgi:membrane-bound lytic murein transglycosylase MltF
MSVPIAWVVGMMVALEPTAPWRPTFQKTAEAIARVAESEPLFDEHGDTRTAALLVAVAWYESRLKPNAKSGNGQWYCLYQIDKRRLGADALKALDDPEICTRTAVKMMRSSLDRCASRPANERLAQFMSGA